ncbi:unnamed protein product [Prunus armeniaca]
MQKTAENQNQKLRCRKPKPETEMKNRLRSLVVFDDGRANGLVVFDDRWWSSMIVGGLEVSGGEVEEVSGGEVERSREWLWFQTKY